MSSYSLKKNWILGLLMMIIGLSIFLLSVYMPKQQITDPSQGSFVPAVISVIMVLCGLVTLAEGRKRSSASDHQAEEKENEYHLTKAHIKLILIFLVTVILFVLSLYIIPFFVAATLYLSISFFLFKHISFKQNIIITLSTVLIIYLLFSRLFHVIFP